MNAPLSDPTPAKHAWQHLPRIDLPKRSVADRIADFMEIYLTLDEETAREQASRCVQCPHPTCVEACPLGNRIPDWLALTAEGQFLEAAQLLESSGCLGDVFPHLCSDPCEPQCVIEGRGEPVAINAVERFLHHYASTHGLLNVQPAKPNGWRVAVMDAGPCGLACAFDLAREGFAVSVLDHHLLPGGLLVNGAPAFRVERTVVQRQIETLRRMGVRFLLGNDAVRDLSLRRLRAEFDAVFFGACAEEAISLRIPGADLAGVYQGLTFLVQNNVQLALDIPPIEVRGKRVVVLGAGDTAMDCLRTAIRSGAPEPTCLFKLDEARLAANHTDYVNACEEGARFEFLADPIALLGNSAGSVHRVLCRRTPLGPSGTPQLDSCGLPGTEFEVPADIVLVAYGYEAAPFLPQGDLSAIQTTREKRIVVDDNLMTNLPGVFAGGTLVRGRCPAVETVRDARKAARAIQSFLGDVGSPRPRSESLPCGA